MERMQTGKSLNECGVRFEIKSSNFTKMVLKSACFRAQSTLTFLFVSQQLKRVTLLASLNQVILTRLKAQMRKDPRNSALKFRTATPCLFLMHKQIMTFRSGPKHCSRIGRQERLFRESRSCYWVKSFGRRFM